MSMEISLDLINQLKLSLRKEANLSSYDPAGDNNSPSLPTVAEAISELDASASYLRCRNCKGKLLRGIESLICVFCGKQQRTINDSPDPIKFTTTSAYKWFLNSLNLDGSEMVEPVKEPNGSSRGAKAAMEEGIALSKFLDLEIQWSAMVEESVKNGHRGDGESAQNLNPMNLGGFSLDDYFVEGRGDLSKVDPAESSKPVEDDDFSDPRSLSLFDSVKSQGVVEPQQNENFGLFQGKDAQKNVSSEEHENLSLFSGGDAKKDGVSLAEQGNFGFFEEKAAQQSVKEDENFSLFDGKDAQRDSSSKDGDDFGFFESVNGQRNSSLKEDKNLDLFESRDGQRNSSYKEDSISFSEQGNFGFFEVKDAQHSLKGDENLSLFEERSSSSKNDESFGIFEGEGTLKEEKNLDLFESKEVRRNSSSGKDVDFGLFEVAPSSNAALQSFADQVVASSSDWDSDFQSADHKPSQEKISGDPFVSSPVDLTAHMDSLFGSGKVADSSSAFVSKAGDWFQDDLFGSVTGKTLSNDPSVDDKNEEQVVGSNGSLSMDIDWIGDDLWQTSEKKPIEKTLTNDNDDDDDHDWNDFASSANSKIPDNPLSPTMQSSQEDISDGMPHIKRNDNEGSEDERQNNENFGLFQGKNTQKNVSSETVEDDLSDPRSFSLFDSVKSQGVIESQENESYGLFQGNDAQKNVTSEESLFSGGDAKDSICLAEQGNFGLFEGKDAHHTFKEDENLSLFGGKDAKSASSSKNNTNFGFFEDKNAQKNSSAKEDKSFDLFESKDVQRNSSYKEDSISFADQGNFGFFERKDAQQSWKGGENLSRFDGEDVLKASSSKDDASFGFFEGKDTKRNSFSKEDVNLSLFKSKDAQTNSSSKDDATHEAGLRSFDEQSVASSTDWDSFDFQSADRNPSQEKISGDPFASSPVDLTAHMESLFASGKPAESSSAFVSNAGDWFQDDLFGSVTGKTQNNDPAVHDKNERQAVGNNGSSSMDIDWIGDDLWQTSEKKPIEKTLRDDNDNDDDYDDEDDWNDFASSADSKIPNNPHVKEGSENERWNTGTSVVSDIAKGQEDDIFGSWNSFTSSAVYQTPMQPPTTNQVNPSAKQNPEMNLFGENNKDIFGSDFFS